MSFKSFRSVALGTVALGASVFLASCGGDGDGGGLITDTNPITAPGTYTRELGVDQLRRSFLIYVPASADFDGGIPVVMVLHGNPPTNMAPLTGMNDVADQLGFAVVYPQSWSSGEWAFACTECNQAGEFGIDDIKYFNGVLTQLRGDMNVDNNRIFITGFSQGALMATRAACGVTNQFAGVGIVGGIPWDWHLENCPSGPMHTLWIMGTSDNQFPFEGEPGPIVSQLSGNDFRDQWATRNGCTGEPTATPVEDTDPTDETTGTFYEFETCTKDFSYYIFDEMDHNWPGSSVVVAGKTNRDLDASMALGEFFMARSR